VATALSATSLGLVVAVLKDAGQEHSAVGQATIAGGRWRCPGFAVLPAASHPKSRRAFLRHAEAVGVEAKRE
jgi:hypothetical protein